MVPLQKEQKSYSDWFAIRSCSSLRSRSLTLTWQASTHREIYQERVSYPWNVLFCPLYCMEDSLSERLSTVFAQLDIHIFICLPDLLGSQCRQGYGGGI